MSLFTHDKGGHYKLATKCNKRFHELPLLGVITNPYKCSLLVLHDKEQLTHDKFLNFPLFLTLSGNVPPSTSVALCASMRVEVCSRAAGNLCYLMKTSRAHDINIGNGHSVRPDIVLAGNWILHWYGYR